MWQHDASEPIGKWLHIYEDDVGLRVTGQICLETQKGRDIRALLKSGVFDGLSIGFKAVKSRKVRNEPYRRLSEIDLWEISLVTFPALKGARVEAVKSLSYTTKGFPDQPRDDRGRWLSTDWEPESGDRVEGGSGGDSGSNKIPKSALGKALYLLNRIYNSQKTEGEDGDKAELNKGEKTPEDKETEQRINDVLGEKAKFVENSKGNTPQYEVPNGTKEEADEDFDKLKPTNVVETTNDKGERVRVGFLPNGDRVIVRPSKEGRPTLEIYDVSRGRRAKEIRYGSK